MNGNKSNRGVANRANKTNTTKVVEKKEVETKTVENKITMKARDSRNNYEALMTELKKYVNEDTVLNLDKRRILLKIRQLFDKYPTTFKKKFDDEWYDYQLRISLNLMAKIKTNKFVKNNILKLKEILPGFNQYKGLYEDMKAEIKKV